MSLGTFFVVVVFLGFCLFVDLPSKGFPLGRYFHYLICFAVKLFMFTYHFTSVITMAANCRHYLWEH